MCTLDVWSLAVSLIASPLDLRCSSLSCRLFENSERRNISGQEGQPYTSNFSQSKHHCRFRFYGTLLIWAIQFQNTLKKNGMKSHMKRPWWFLGHWTALNFVLHVSELKPLFYIWLKISMECVSFCSGSGSSEKWADVSLHSECLSLIIRLLIQGKLPAHFRLDTVQSW